jgi:hypothetical protein
MKDSRQRLQIVSFEGEESIGPLGGVDEEANTTGLEGFIGGVPVDDQTGQVDDRFPGDAQLHPTGDQDLHPGCPRQNSGEEGRSFDDMLEVVEDQELSFVDEMSQELGLQVIVASERDAERLRSGLGDCPV